MLRCGRGESCLTLASRMFVMVSVSAPLLLMIFFELSSSCGCSGPLLVDEAVDIAKGVCTANSNCILLVLLPQQNASIESSAITAHRRALEDRLSNLGLTLIELIPTSYFQCNVQFQFVLNFHDRSNCECRPRTLESFEMGLYFKDSGHGGDRRKRSQP